MAGRSVANAPRTPARKRKAALVDLTGEESDEQPVSKAPKRSPVNSNKKGSSKKDPSETTPEKRLRKWRTGPPQAYLERRERAMHQRTRNGTSDSPSEELLMAGTTGNLYTVTIAALPSCTCPDSIKHNLCKHIIYALVRVLKAPAHLRYQLSFLKDELESIFRAAPLPTDEVSEEEADVEHPSNRKPISGDCPICFCEMDGEDPKDVVWCRAACGNNVHKSCFQQWAKTSRSDAASVRCVYCRAEWEADDVGQRLEGDSFKGGKDELAALRANAVTGQDGYDNIGEELGLSPYRDTSSYSRWGRYS